MYREIAYIVDPCQLHQVTHFEVDFCVEDWGHDLLYDGMYDRTDFVFCCLSFVSCSGCISISDRIQVTEWYHQFEQWFSSLSSCSSIPGMVALLVTITMACTTTEC